MRKAYLKSSGRRTIREQLGITQKDWAFCCGITRSHLAMIESGERSRPLDPDKSDFPLDMAFFNSQSEPADLSAAETLSESALASLRSRLRLISIERYKKNKELEQMQDLLKVGRDLLQFVHRLRQDPPRHVQGRPALLNLWEIQAKEYIEQNHESLQALVHLSLRQLAEEEALIQGLLPGEGAGVGEKEK
jgi:transcriptional regulator with XRE-family HTH domain